MEQPKSIPPKSTPMDEANASVDMHSDALIKQTTHDAFAGTAAKISVPGFHADRNVTSSRRMASDTVSGKTFDALLQTTGASSMPESANMMVK